MTLTLLQANLATSTPCEPSLNFHNFDSPNYPNELQFRRLIGRLIYLITTRLDISFVVQQFSLFM